MRVIQGHVVKTPTPGSVGTDKPAARPGKNSNSAQATGTADRATDTARPLSPTGVPALRSEAPERAHHGAEHPRNNMPRGSLLDIRV